MNRENFYAALRKSRAVFGTSLSAQQTQGTNALLAACRENGITDAHHVANILAQCYHETGGGMWPVKETVFRHHKDRNPTDATVIARLDRAYQRGQLPWVSSPYWRDGWFGRGFIQITHKANYDKFGIGKDEALKPSVAARVAVVGMRDGMFRRVRLADFPFPASLHEDPEKHPRRIVNGPDGADDDVTRYHMAFYDAIHAAGGWSAPVAPPAREVPKPRGLFAWLLSLFGGRK